MHAHAAHSTVQAPWGRAAWILVGLVAALAAAHLAWPGDVGFIYDEPNLMRKALDANREGTLAKSGLLGSFGVEYGPVCVWFYQALLGLSRDLTWAVVAKAALGWAAIVLALVQVARATGMSPWPLLLVPVSPFAWHFVRTLHDIVFLVPLSALMFATVASLLERPSVARLAVWAGLCALAIHVHLIACVPIAATALVLAVFQGRWLRERATVVAVVLAAALVASAPFLWRVLTERIPGNHPHPEFWHSVGLAARAFLYSSHAGFDHYVPAFYASAAWVRGLALATAVPALALGAAGLVRFAREAWRERANPSAWPLDRKLAALATALVLGQLALIVVLRLEAYWHYFSGVWLGGFYLCWWGFERLPFARALRPVLVADALACAVLTAGIAWHVHEHGGDRTPTYGATLANQREVAQRIVEERLAAVEPRVANYAMFPVALQVLVELAAGDRTFTPLPGPTAGVIDYRDADPASGFIELRLIPARAPAGERVGPPVGAAPQPGSNTRPDERR